MLRNIATMTSLEARAEKMYKALDMKELLTPVELDAILLASEALSYLKQLPYKTIVKEYSKD